MIGDFDASRRGSGTLPEMTMDVLTPKIADITAEGLSLSGDLTGEELGLTDGDVAIRGTLAVGLDLRAIERTIYVTGVVEGTAIRQCVRCLKDFADPLAFSLRVAYEREAKSPNAVAKRDDPRKKKSAGPPEGEAEEQNDDLYYFTGDHLELAPMLREQLILAAPMHPLCSEECRGLCARCGKDLNEGPCRCGEEPTGSPFQVLRTIKDKLMDPRER
ncbi:MAG: DUF177 domain-containing protein [Nitrospira sp.]|nr:DUF177 domain-containing protein [Nitrospira sp.]MDI3464735.1 uncharacterized protein [Nitrospira sp.]